MAVCLGAPFLAIVGVVAWWVVRAGALAALDPMLLRRLGAAAAALGAISALSVLEVALSTPSGRAAVALTLLPVLTGGTGLAVTFDHAAAIEDVFIGQAVAAEPSAEAAADGRNPPVVPAVAPPDAPAPTVVSSSMPATTISTPPQRWNVLLIGGDGERGRSGVRTDAMVLVSVGRDSSDVAMVSIPRNLNGLPLPVGSALRARYPDGWPDLANSLYNHVLATPADGDGSSHAPERMLSGALAEALGVRIDNYVKVDMVGFIRVVDVLGGVDVDIANPVPGPGPIYGAEREARDVYGPGRTHLDGTDALYYSRSREGDSDYARMARQRCLLATAARQVSPARLLTKYRDLLGVMEDAVRSDLSPAQARGLIELFTDLDTSRIRSLGLAPPFVDTARPDYPAIRRLVRQALEPVPVAPGPTSTSSSSTSVPAIGSTTATTSPIAVLSEGQGC